jgi:hypothetical protein
MKFGHRLALLLWLALPGSAGFMARSSAGEVAATSARIVELSRAGKYSEALPLAQRQLDSLEKARGPVDRDVAGALNNLAQLYGDLGKDAEAEPLLKRSIAIMEKAISVPPPPTFISLMPARRRSSARGFPITASSISLPTAWSQAT